MTPDITTLSIEEIAAEIRTTHSTTLAGSRCSLDNAKRLGDLLQEVKSRLRHGEWLPWLAAKCDVSRRMVQNYRLISREWDGRLAEWRNGQSIAHLDISGALWFLAKSRGDDGENDGENDDEDETDIDEDELNTGGCDGDGDDTDDSNDTGNSRDEQTQRFYLLLSVKRCAQLRRQVRQFAERYGLKASTESDRFADVVDHIYTQEFDGEQE